MSRPSGAAIVEATLAALPGFLVRQRWYGDKSRTIAGLSSLPTTSISLGDRWFMPLVVEVRFTTGPVAHYLVPILLGRRHPEPQAIARIIHNGTEREIVDATVDLDFQRWLVDRLSTDAPEPLRAGLHRVPVRLSAAEQSNTSLIFGDLAIAKLFRKLQPGIHPEVELSRFLTQRAGFTHVPAFLGSWELELPGLGPASASVLQGWVPNQGDCWSALLLQLREGLQKGLIDGALALPGLLGQRTAELHVALASDPWTPAVAPEPITREEALSASTELVRRIRELALVLPDAPVPDVPAAELIASTLAALPSLERRAGGYERLVGRHKTRVHGDLHLGQLLFQTNGDVAFLDFEGEPMRPLEERRKKASPLKDVAGMFRSFSYAHGAAREWVNETPPEGSPGAALLVDWERSARSVFLERYLDVIRRDAPMLIPESHEHLRLALTAWELDKAVYEVHYELNNRPGWLWLPLTGLLKLV